MPKARSIVPEVVLEEILVYERTIFDYRRRKKTRWYMVIIWSNGRKTRAVLHKKTARFLLKYRFHGTKSIKLVSEKEGRKATRDD